MLLFVPFSFFSVLFFAGTKSGGGGGVPTRLWRKDFGIIRVRLLERNKDVYTWHHINDDGGGGGACVYIRTRCRPFLDRHTDETMVSLSPET